MQLYQAQANVVQTLINAYQANNIYRDSKIYVSGETGVGKTYIGSAIANDELTNQHRPVLIVTPSTVVLKWKRVLIETNSDLKEQIDCITRPKELTAFNKKITIISVDLLHRWLKQYRHTLINMTDQSLPFLIFDEIHKIQKSQLEAFAHLIAMQTAEHRMPMLLLSGTIFNRSWHDLGQLLTLTHPHLIAHALNIYEISPSLLAMTQRTVNKVNHPSDEGYQNLDDVLPVTISVNDFDFYPWQSHKKSELNDSQRAVKKLMAAAVSKMASSQIYSLSNFISRIWQYISVGIGLDDVQELSSNVDEIKQEVMPIKAIPLSKLERAYLSMTRQFYRGTNKNTREMFIMNYLDQPARSNLLKPKQHGRVDWFSDQQMYYVNFRLKPITIQQTAKFHRLQAIIQQAPNKRFLIYAHDTQVIDILCKELNAFTLTNDVDSTEYADYINQQFEQGHNIAVIDPRKISEGIDISADYLIWYQLIDNYNQMLQAQRRVYRLSSTRKSRVYYLIYEDTQQEATAKNLSNAAKNNAAVHGAREEDNLAKLTGILLKGIK